MTAKSIAVYLALVATMFGFQNCQKSDRLEASVGSGRAPASDGSFARRIDFSSDIAKASQDQLKLRAENRKLGEEAIRQTQLGIQASRPVNAVDNREPIVVIQRRQ